MSRLGIRITPTITTLAVHQKWHAMLDSSLVSTFFRHFVSYQAISVTYDFRAGQRSTNYTTCLLLQLYRANCSRISVLVQPNREMAQM